MDQVDMQSLFPLLDRLLSPVTERLLSMEGKLDKALEVAGRVNSLDEAHDETKDRVHSLELAQALQTIQLAKAEGRNAVIMWMLGLIGAPIVVALAIAGVFAVLGIGAAA